LVLTEPLDLFFEVSDLLFKQSPFLHVGLFDLGQLRVLLADCKLSVIELLFQI
jgi:hypothetical protein